MDYTVSCEDRLLGLRFPITSTKPFIQGILVCQHRRRFESQAVDLSDKVILRFPSRLSCEQFEAAKPLRNFLHKLSQPCEFR